MPGIYGDVNLTALGNDADPNVRKPEGDTPAPANAGASALMPPDFAGKGPLLEEPDDKKVFKAIDKIVEKQEPLAKNRAAAAKHRKRIRNGVPFSVLNKDEDRNVWTAELPPGGSDQPSPVPNKADDLCRKIVSQVIVDLPQPDPKPATDSEQDRGAADLAKRFLKVDGDESGTNDPELFREALDTNQTDASSFAHVWVDMQGDGWRPLRIKAHPQAVDTANPLVAMDPVTGQELPTADYVLRYVTESGQFTENPAEAAMQWMPKIKRDLLGQAHVRTVPETADVHRAEAVILLMCGPLSDLKRRVPEIAQWGDAELGALADWKPRRAKVLVPTALKARFKEQADAKGSVDVGDDTLVFWYQKYCRVSGSYPDGAEIIVSGADGGLVLKKATLRKDLPGEDEKAVVLLRDIPVSQCRALHDTDTRDPFGKCPIDNFGNTNEGLAQLYGGVLEDTDKRLHPNFFVTATSPVQAWQVTQRTGEGITVVSKDDMPMYEQFADLSSFTPEVISLLEKSMETAAMLGSAAQNLNTTDAVSGTAKSIELTQAKTNLAPYAQGFFAFVKRYWRLKLEAAQAFLTIPQQVEYAGVDQSYKQRWFTGADFAGVKDVAVQAGTGTLMGAGEKQGYLQVAQANGWLDPDEAGAVGRSTVADDLGVTGSPHEDTIKREIAQWMEGPPEPPEQVDPMAPPAPTWAEQYQAWATEQQSIQQQMAATPQGADTQPQATPQPQTPAPWSPFAARPTDDDPTVAPKQYKILRDFVASADYMKHPPEWRAMLDQRLLKARQAAGIATVAEQQAAAKAQADKDAMEKDKDREHERSEGEANRQAKAQQQVAA